MLLPRLTGVAKFAAEWVSLLDIISHFAEEASLSLLLGMIGGVGVAAKAVAVVGLS